MRLKAIMCAAAVATTVASAVINRAISKSGGSEGNSGGTVKSGGGDILKQIGEKGLSELEAKIEKYKTHSMKKMGERIEPAGFEMLQTYICHVEGTMHVSDLKETFQDILKLHLFKNLQKFQKDDIMIKLMILKRFIQRDPRTVQTIDLNFTGVNDRMNIFQVSMRYALPDEGGQCVYLRTLLVNTTFKPAQPYVVVTHSKSNMFGSKQWDEIQYLPATLKSEHLKAINSNTLAMIVGYNVSLLPLLNPPQYEELPPSVRQLEEQAEQHHRVTRVQFDETRA